MMETTGKCDSLLPPVSHLVMTDAWQSSCISLLLQNTVSGCCHQVKAVHGRKICLANTCRDGRPLLHCTYLESECIVILGTMQQEFVPPRH